MAFLLLFAVYCSQKLFRSHFESSATEPRYVFERDVPACRGAIYDAAAGASPMVKSVPCWEYRLDPVALTNATVRPRGEKLPRTRQAICRTIANALSLDYAKVLAMSENPSKRYQYLAQSTDAAAHAILSDRRLVAGVVIEDKQVRQYLHGKRLCHVIGSMNKEGVGSAGLELKYDRELSGVPGCIRGCRDARGAELYDKRIETVAPIPGADIHLTVDRNLQYEAETALADGIREFGAGSGWCVILDVKTADVLAMVSYPDFNPLFFGRAKDAAKVNRATSLTYEPGSVMKVITAAAGIDSGFVKPDSLYTTNRDDDRYYRLPGDGSHVWEPRMSVKDAIVHSSNIVIGKLGFDLGPKTLWTYMKAFGFGSKTGIELPGEEMGLLPFWQKWDKVKWSRAPIGQGVAVTAMQLASAYQAIANDGVRMKPHIVQSIVQADGHEIYTKQPEVASRPISRGTARELRRMMLGVASPDGTARRAAIKGYSVAGKTGTAQKVVNGRYSDSLYRATFCGIVPSGAVKRIPADPDVAEPRIVVLVTLDFDQRTKFHQGGNSAAPIFRRVATAALRYLHVEPDRPDELMDLDDADPLDKIMESRERTL
ncbi:MAG: penicillin-binding protein 2 [Kiritimatiellae bacterium]|nr:penicillin-binding protein 2 [Kiritimatiellia bacterium]